MLSAGTSGRPTTCKARGSPRRSQTHSWPAAGCSPPRLDTNAWAVLKLPGPWLLVPPRQTKAWASTEPFCFWGLSWLGAVLCVHPTRLCPACPPRSCGTGRPSLETVTSLVSSEPGHVARPHQGSAGGAWTQHPLPAELMISNPLDSLMSPAATGGERFYDLQVTEEASRPRQAK